MFFYGRQTELFPFKYIYFNFVFEKVFFFFFILLITFSSIPQSVISIVSSPRITRFRPFKSKPSTVYELFETHFHLKTQQRIKTYNIIAKKKKKIYAFCV